MRYSRRDVVKIGMGTGAALALGWRPGGATGQAPELRTRPIPSSGERIPVVGIGTARRYDVATSVEERAPLGDTLKLFSELGGQVVDTAPSYGNAETVVGDLVDELAIRDRLFLATKVRAEGQAAGRDQIEESFRRLRTDRFDLLQVHNLRDTDTQLTTLRALKAEGRTRYIGITTSSSRQYDELADVMEREDLDFIQVNYSLATRVAADRILPLAQDRGMAVLINLPFGRSRLFQAVGDRPLPEWAADFDAETWGQFFLKYILGDDAVTCVIPGTAKTKYAIDNLGAARGRLPNPDQRKKMEEFYDSLIP
jgi:aryl-alcohol dehydrogenase-like predicted oxidoreductase